MRDHLESAIARAFLEVSQQTIVIADHSKVGQTALARFAPFSAVEHLITDAAISSSWRACLEGVGLPVEIAPDLRNSLTNIERGTR